MCLRGSGGHSPVQLPAQEPVGLGERRLQFGRSGPFLASPLSENTGFLPHSDIAADHLSHIFEMFSRGQPALARSQDGLGIGLSLVRGLVTLQGGEVSARSAGRQQGSASTGRLRACGCWWPMTRARLPSRWRCC